MIKHTDYHLPDPGFNDSHIEHELTRTTFVQRENNNRHLAYDKEMLQYEYIKTGNIEGIKSCFNDFSPNTAGHLSDNPLRNSQYLFVCSATLSTRFAVEGGMEPEIAYNASDLFIQRADKLTSPEEILELHKEMTLYFTKHIATLKKMKVFSKPVVLSMDYIYYHLHESIKVTDIAKQVSLNPTYLSTLFKKEVGQSISDYINQKRVESASNLLKYSDYSYVDISNYLAFSSHSYFVSVFKRYTGLTPKAYRKKYFRVSFHREKS